MAENDETPCARWGFTKGIMLNYIIWYRAVCVMTRNNFRKKKYWRNVIRSKRFGASQKEIQKQMFSKQLERQSFSDLKEFLFSK